MITAAALGLTEATVVAILVPTAVLVAGILGWIVRTLVWVTVELARLATDRDQHERRINAVESILLSLHPHVTHEIRTDLKESG